MINIAGSTMATPIIIVYLSCLFQLLICFPYIINAVYVYIYYPLAQYVYCNSLCMFAGLVRFKITLVQ